MPEWYNPNVVYLIVAMGWCVWALFRKDVMRDAISIGIITGAIVVSPMGSDIRIFSEGMLILYYLIMVLQEFVIRKKSRDREND